MADLTVRRESGYGRVSRVTPVHAAMRNCTRDEDAMGQAARVWHLRRCSTNRTQPRPQPQQETQQRPNPQREAKEVPAPRPPAPEATQAELVRTEKTEPEKQNQSSERQPAASPPTEQTPEQPNIAEAVAQYVALGGPLGGGFAAPPVDTNVSGYDWTAPFRERVSVCSKVPEGVEPGDKVSIKVRVSFNRDGTVASPPRLLVPAPSAKQQALMESAVDALERCRPSPCCRRKNTSSGRRWCSTSPRCLCTGEASLWPQVLNERALFKLTHYPTALIL